MAKSTGTNCSSGVHSAGTRARPPAPPSPGSTQRLSPRPSIHLRTRFAFTPLACATAATDATALPTLRQHLRLELRAVHSPRKDGLAGRSLCVPSSSGESPYRGVRSGWTTARGRGWAKVLARKQAASASVPKRPQQALRPVTAVAPQQPSAPQQPIGAPCPSAPTAASTSRSVEPSLPCR